MATQRWRAAGGIAGPSAFVAAWSILGRGRDGYSPVHDPISRLAALDAETSGAMTVGFLAFGVGVGLYATALRRALPGGAAAAAASTAAATLAVGALPLGSSGGGVPHAIAAATAYASLAATPALGARTFFATGRRAAGRVSIAASGAVAAALTLSATLPRGAGLAQRVGLTIGDVWIMSTAAAIVFRAQSRHKPADAQRAGP